MSNPTILIEAHRQEVRRLRAAGDHRSADALEAAIRNFIEAMERTNGRAGK
jgi:hypothetical protein